MTQEIVDAVKMLEQEKGIAADTLMDALQDALLSAYKKTPGAAKYAKVELDHNTADFRVFELMVPEDLEKRLLDEQFEEQLQAAEAAEAAGEPIPEIEINRPTVDPETGERREAIEPEVEPMVDEQPYDDASASDELVAALAGGGALSFAPDDDDLLPGGPPAAEEPAAADDAA